MCVDNVTIGVPQVARTLYLFGATSSFSTLPPELPASCTKRLKQILAYSGFVICN